MLLAAVFTVTERWKHTKGPLTDKQITKMLYSHALEYYSAIKTNGVLMHATTWLNSEDIMLSEISQTQTNIV